MAALTEEEDNFFRIFKLIGTSTKAVRIKFDSSFPPSTLNKTVKQNETKLKSLKCLNASQLSLLFPSSGPTCSTTYDLTLMICLLRNLASINPPINGFDCLPLKWEVCDGADLARVKYYRNQTAHSEKHVLTTSDFHNIWLDLSEAIIRLGGIQFKAECDDLMKQKPDDDFHVELMRMIQTFKDEVMLEMKELTHRMDACECYDFHQAEIDDWLKEHNKFVTTDAVDFVLHMIQKNKRITVTGIPGVGKSALIRHVALYLCNEHGYNIIPCNSPSKIEKHFKKDKLQIFVFDDVCGRYVINQSDVNKWTNCQKSILKVLTKGNIIIISSCRLQIFKESRFQNIALLSNFYCDLSSERFALTKQLRIDIACQYIHKDKVKEIENELQNCKILPLVCSLYQTKKGITAHHFFSNPFHVYTQELELLFEGNEKLKICSLFLLVVKNGCVTKDWLVSKESDALDDILEICGISRRTSRMEIVKGFDSLVNTYLRNVENLYETIHDKLFDFLCFYFGSRMQEELIKYAERKVIYERMVFCEIDELDSDFSVVITEKNEDVYLQRIFKDISDGFIIDVLYSKSITEEKFRTIIVNFLNTQTDEVMIKMVKTRYHHCGDTSLQIACSLGYTEIVKCMIAFINDINVVQADEFPPLHQACFQGHDQIVKLFIEKGANLNIAGYNGWTPLMLACEGRRHEIVDLLVQKGANLNEITTGGRTLLTEWCLLGNDTIVDWLIRGGAKVNLADDTGETPLTLACGIGHHQIISLLIQNGADVNCCNRDGQTTILMTVINAVNNQNSRNDKECECNMHSTICSVCETSFQIIDLLISNGADVNKPDHNGWTALHEVCVSYNIPCLRELIKRKPNINQTLDDLRTPLMMACERGYKEVVVCLVDNGADVNLSDEEGFTSLILACENKHFDIAKYLICNGAHVKQVLKAIDRNMINHHFGNLVDNLKDMDINWISEACIVGNTYIISYLMKKGATVTLNATTESDKHTLLLNSCRRNHDDIVQLLINAGTDVNKQTGNGNSALLTACLAGNYNIVEMLINAGSNVNILNSKNETPLMIACSIGNLPIAQFLIDKGANVNMSDICGNTALIHATRYEIMYLGAGPECKTTIIVKDQFPLVRVLLNNNVCINQKNAIRESPLILAINYHCEELAIKLIDNYADCNQMDTNGYSPLMIAVKNKLENVVIALMKRRKGKPKVDIDLKRPNFIIVSVNNNDIEKMRINIKGKDINTLLKIAIKYNEANIVVFLLDSGVDIENNAANYDAANTALKFAIKSGSNDIAIILLEKGTDIKKVNKDGKTLLMLAVEFVRKSVLYSCNRDCWLNSPKTSSTELINSLLERGANINAVDNDGKTVLEVTIKSGLYAIAMILLDKGADINKVNKDGKTPLMLAIECFTKSTLYTYNIDSSTKLLRALLKRGADINAADKDKNTVLELALKSRDDDFIKIFLDIIEDMKIVKQDRKNFLMAAIDFLNYYFSF